MAVMARPERPLSAHIGSATTRNGLHLMIGFSVDGVNQELTNPFGGLYTLPLSHNSAY